jgi:hypothetical protein
VDPAVLPKDWELYDVVQLGRLMDFEVPGLKSVALCSQADLDHL